jgi:hypothetical protein
VKANVASSRLLFVSPGMRLDAEYWDVICAEIRALGLDSATAEPEEIAQALEQGHSKIAASNEKIRAMQAEASRLYREAKDLGRNTQDLGGSADSFRTMMIAVFDHRELRRMKALRLNPFDRDLFFSFGDAQLDLGSFGIHLVLHLVVSSS